MKKLVIVLSFLFLVFSLTVFADPIPIPRPETDPVFMASDANGINSTDIGYWNIAYGWGDHSGLYDAAGTASAAVMAHLIAFDHNDIGTGGSGDANAVMAEHLGTYDHNDIATAISWGDWGFEDFNDITNDDKINWNTAYTHSQDNTQAHSDYMLNTGDTASGDYTFDTTTFKIDATNNRVGVGTTTPNAMVEVYNSSSIATFRLNNGVSTAGYGGSQLQFFGSASPAAKDAKNFAINNANTWSSGGENTITIQARKDDGTWKQDLIILTQNNGYVYLPKVYSHDVGAVRDLLIKSDGQLGYNSSSIKYKDNVKDYVNASDIYKLRPVEYNRKDGSSINEKGLIAEEVMLADVNIPNLVSYKRGEKIIDTGEKDEFGNPITKIQYYDTNEPETVNYTRLIVPMLKALQDQNEKIKELEARIVILEKKAGQR